MAQPLSPPVTAADVCRGTCRLLVAQGHAPVVEVPLADGRRADIVALGADGQIQIIEIKVSVADLVGDRKWPHYRSWCDAFWWAVPAALAPRLGDARFRPDESGLIVADRFEACVERLPVAMALPAARRRAMQLRVARLAALRLARSTDPALEPQPGSGW